MGKLRNISTGQAPENERSRQERIAYEIDQWMGNGFSILKGSAWSPALEYDGVDVLEALRSPLFTILLGLGQHGSDERWTNRGGSIFAALANGVQSRISDYIGRKMVGRNSAEVKQVPVVFWPREPTHIQVQHPVSTALREMGIDNQFLVCQPGMFNELQLRGIQSAYTRAIWCNDLTVAWRNGKRVARLLKKDPGVTLPPFPLGVRNDLVVEVVRRRVSQLIPRVHEAITSTNKLIDTRTPRILVVGNDLTFEGRTASLVAHLKGLQTVCMMHGSVSGSPLQRHHLAGSVLVYGQNSKRQLLSYSMKQSQITICGPPHLDNRPTQTYKVHPKIQTLLNLNGKPLVLVATSGPGHSVSLLHHKMIIENIMRLSQRLPDIHFVAKLHRKDRVEYYKRIQKLLVPGSKLDVVPNGINGVPSSIFDWLQGCSAVLTGASTVATEAMLMEVPVVTMDFRKELDGVDFIDGATTLHVTNFRDLEEAVRMILYCPETIASLKVKAHTFISDEYFGLDGLSSKRCAQTIRKLIQPRLS